ncbi:hypothetical protein MKX08_009581 [Trichoderma sp. CBMAI-0020]|nr:hypothetical protein MKX08_009581 [Trichoderma sp. CBMAI-0020]
MDNLHEMFAQLHETNVTKTVHRQLYPAISPKRPELSQAGKVVLIPGGGTGVGYGIARSFVQASADTVILLGRRVNILEEAATKLEEEAKKSNTNTKIIKQACDMTNPDETRSFWNSLAAKGVTIDVLVANVAKFSEPKPIFELGSDEVWSQFEVNVKSHLYFTEQFYSQSNGKKKYLINVSSQVIHMTAHAGVAQRPAYTLSKMAATLLFQVIAQNTPVTELQVISFHPGLIFNDAWKSMGLTSDLFDSDEVCGGFAVWAATEQAQFLHGRFVWSSWDVDELAMGEIRKRIDEDPYFLKSSIVGLNGALLT